MAKPFLWLILVWTVVCASGLAVFLLQSHTPILPLPADDYSGSSTAIVFWIIAWAVPSVILVIAGRRQKE